MCRADGMKCRAYKYNMMYICCCAKTAETTMAFGLLDRAYFIFLHLPLHCLVAQSGYALFYACTRVCSYGRRLSRKVLPRPVLCRVRILT